jgi:hypothetical protein
VYSTTGKWTKSVRLAGRCRKNVTPVARGWTASSSPVALPVTLPAAVPAAVPAARCWIGLAPQPACRRGGGNVTTPGGGAKNLTCLGDLFGTCPRAVSIPSLLVRGPALTPSRAPLRRPWRSQVRCPLALAPLAAPRRCPSTHCVGSPGQCALPAGGTRAPPPLPMLGEGESSDLRLTCLADAARIYDG